MLPGRKAREDELSYARIVHAVLLAALPCVASAQNPASPEVLSVTRYADDGNEGSLRFAIEASNRAPGRYRIEIEAVGSAPYVIKPNAQARRASKGSRGRRPANSSFSTARATSRTRGRRPVRARCRGSSAPTCAPPPIRESR